MERLISRLAAKTKMPPAKAADGIDKLVHKIRTAVRKGETAELPGLGKFGPGEGIQFVGEAPRSKTQKGDVHGNHQRTTVQPAPKRSR